MESEPGDRIRSPIKLADHVDPDEGPDLDSILSTFRERQRQQRGK